MSTLAVSRLRFAWSVASDLASVGVIAAGYAAPEAAFGADSLPSPL
jgi:hypothetical protein